MLSVHIITSLGPKGSLRWIRSCLPSGLKWIYEVLYHDEALVERFVSFHLCLSVGIVIVSPYVSLILFQSLTRFCACFIYVCVLTFDHLFFYFYFFWRWWLSAQEKWSPSLSVQPFELRVGGSKLSIKCFCWGREKIWYSGETKVICSRKFNCLSQASLSFSLASPPNQFQMKVQVQMRFNFESVVQPTLCELWNRFDASVYLCLCERAAMTQMYFLTCCGESECHNRRKLAPRSHKPDLLLQEVQVSRGNIPLFNSVKILDPNTAEVCPRSEIERCSGRCPPLLWYQKTPSERRSLWQEDSIATLGSEVVFWIVSWGKPREGEATLCQVFASQAWFGWRRSCYDSRNLWAALRPRGSASHQTTGHPLFSEEARVLLNPSAQYSPLTMLTKSPVQVRFTLNSQSSQMKS